MIRFFLTLLNTLLFIAFVNSQTNCSIKNLKATALPCSFDKKFSVKIQFEVENQGNLGFKIQGNGKIYGSYSYDDLPIIIEGLEGNCETPYEFVVRDIAQPVCAAEYNLGKICCDGSCELNIINAHVSECFDNDRYKLGFDIFATGTKKVGFDLFANNNHVGFYKYNQLPITNISLASSANPFETIVACESDNLQCCDTMLLASPCNCNIHNIRSQVIECSAENQSYYLRINFDHNKTSDSFLIGGSSVLHGTFAYADLPVFIGPFNFGDEIGELLIADKTDIFCFGAFEPKVVEKCTHCEIKELSASVTACNEDGELYVKLKFIALNPGVNGFTIRGNGTVYGQHYNYSDGIYYIGPLVPNCSQNYEFVIIDNANPACKNEILFNEKLCCKDCSLSQMVVTPICGGEFNRVKVQYEGSTDADSMYVLINNVIVKKISSTENPFTLFYEFIEGTVYKLSIISAEDESCKLVKEFKFLCEGEGDCGFSNVNFLLTECNEENQFYVKLKFTPTGQHSNKFKVNVNGKIFGPYEYGNDLYEIGPVPHTCEGIRIELFDVEFTNCKFVKEFDEDKCCNGEEGCNIGEYKFETICFEGKIIGLTALVEGKEGQAFDLYLAGNLIGRYKYSSIPFIINKNLEKGFIAIKIVDAVNTSCIVQFQMFLNCDNCSINNFSAKGVDCTEHTAHFIVNFNYNNNPSDSFYLQINDDVFGPYGYNELPVIPDKYYDPAGDLYYNFKILDAEKNCGLIINVLYIDCLSSSIDTPDEDFVLIYGSQGKANIVLKDYTTTAIEVFTLDGKKIMNKINLTGKNTEVVLPSGQLFFIKVYDQQRSVTKLISTF